MLWPVILSNYLGLQLQGQIADNGNNDNLSVNILIPKTDRLPPTVQYYWQLPTLYT